MNPEDKLMNIRFGRLVVVGEYKPGKKAINETNYYSARVYPSVMCKCDCGNYRRINVHNLRAGSSVSCGCFRKEISAATGQKVGRSNGLKHRIYSTEESSARDLYQKYMARHKENLDFEKFNELTKLNCYYCNCEPYQIYLVENRTDDKGKYIYNGLDRINNNEGYDVDNVRTCCGVCNFMKRTLTDQQFYDQVLKIAAHMKNS